MDSGIIIQHNRNVSNGQTPFELVESSNPQTYSSLYAYGLADQHPLLGYWRFLKKRRWTILATFVIVLVIVGIATLRMTRLY